MKSMNTRVQAAENDSKAMWPAPGFAGRIRMYLREMYPLPARLVTAMLLYLSFTLLLAAVGGRSPRWDLEWILVGGLGGFLLALILRLMDELKDSQIDRHLFPERPVPSGRVRLTDIRIALAVSSLLFLLLHVKAGVAFFSASFVLAYSFLMFRYFFLPPRWKSKLLVNLATHNPVVAVLLLHYVVLFTGQYGVRFDELPVATFALVGMYWAVLLSWELSRKVRYRGEETDYQTYSRIFGPVGAVTVAWCVQTLAVAAGLFLGVTCRLSAVYVLVLLAAYAWMVRGHVRFLQGKLASGKLLKGTAEQFAGLVMSAILVEWALQTVTRHDLF